MATRGQGHRRVICPRQGPSVARLAPPSPFMRRRRVQFSPGSSVALDLEMAEICCDVAVAEVAKEASVASREAVSRLERRRRMGIRRFRLVADAGDQTAEAGRKRRRLSCSGEVAVGETRLSLEPPRMGIERPAFGVVSICGRSRDMEDAFSVRPDFDRTGPTHHFFGVYDGHGCSHVAGLCRDRMHELVEEEMLRLGPGSPPSEAWTGLMKRSFSLMDSLAVARRLEAAGVGSNRANPRCRCELQTLKCDTVGSTAVVAVVGLSNIVVANCGDSRAVLCRGGAPIPLSSDHKPDRPDELSRIEAAGGRVIYWQGARVLGVLAMSRAIGDGYLKPYVTSEPEVTVTERSEADEFLLLGSDGLWDVMTNEMACDVVRTCFDRAKALNSDKACSDAATLLAKLALARHSADNVTVVVVDLRKPAKSLQESTCN
ncbi:hypothetical protein ZIOFF_049534 [Zingiber officinale]|uniref:protein-serine/threonine phosphatase n=2 Tax=Zingiber officinale TaxID=94328 RepID=A0A8J5G1W7_ZINOF|nr:hypothetical protein ZIOFF_049534 [Zingiber officinale]